MQSQVPNTDLNMISVMEGRTSVQRPSLDKSGPYGIERPEVFITPSFVNEINNAAIKVAK